MSIFEHVKVKVTNTQLTKLKSAAKIKAGKTLRKIKKKFQDEELPHEKRKKAKVRNPVDMNFSTDVNLVKLN